ncbi:MAG: SURF1 family protein [Pseudomonadota bacterium]
MSTPEQLLRLRWDIEWRSAVFVALLVPVFISLGLWQLSRADEKRAIAAQYEARRQLAPVPLSALPLQPADLAHRRVTLRGAFISERTFLLDNRIRDGRYGVEVVTPFDTGQHVVLVNLGWMEGDQFRRSLPAPPPLAPVNEITGSVYVQPGESYTLGAIDSDNRWPRLVQALDVEAMGELLGQPVWPYSVRVDLESPVALVAEWALVNMRPEKHGAYALQWFAMAFTLLVIGLWRNTTLPALWRQRRSDLRHAEATAATVEEKTGP